MPFVRLSGDAGSESAGQGFERLPHGSTMQKETAACFYLSSSLRGFASDGCWGYTASPIFPTSLMMITDLSPSKKKKKREKRKERC